MSSERRPGLLAVLVGRSGRMRQTISGAVDGVIEVVAVDGREDGSLPPAPLVLVRGSAPRRELLEQVRRLRGRYRERGWYAVAAGDKIESARAAWKDLVDGVMPGPVPIEMLAALARERAERVRARRAHARTRRRSATLEDRLSLLSNTIQAAGALLDPGMVSQFIMERAAGIVGSTRWRLYRADEGAGLLHLDAWAGPESPGQRPARQMPLDRGLAGWTARSSRRVVSIPEARGDDRIDRELEWPGSAPDHLLAVPLVSRGRVIGIAELADPEAAPLSRTQIDTVRTLMEPAAIALDNAVLFRKLEERTVTDDLTRLYNARFMDNYLRRETKRAARYGHLVSVLFLDLDGFKQVNDVYGHMAGSRTLVEVGQVLRENVREIDVVTRWGGDEFAVVLPETGIEGAVTMAERICERIRETTYLEVMGLSIRISASIGVACWPESGEDAAALLAAADAAMYHVKNSGKDGVHLGLREPLPVAP